MGLMNASTAWCKRSPDPAQIRGESSFTISCCVSRGKPRDSREDGRLDGAARLLCSPFDGRRGHRHKAVDLVSHIATAVRALHEDDADQVFRRIHPSIGAIGAALYETTDRVISKRAKHLADHLETEAVTHSGGKACLHGAGLRCGHGAARYETSDRVISKRAKHLADHLETEAVTHSGGKACLHGAGLR